MDAKLLSRNRHDVGMVQRVRKEVGSHLSPILATVAVGVSSCSEMNLMAFSHHHNS